MRASRSGQIIPSLACLRRLVADSILQRSRFNPRQIFVGFMVDYVDLREVPLCVLRFSLSASLYEFHVLIFHSSLTDATMLISESLI
jgi:hypothetical protein